MNFDLKYEDSSLDKVSPEMFRINSNFDANSSIEELLHKMCFIKDDNMFFDYIVFKHMYKLTSYDTILMHLVKITNEILTNYKLLNIHVCLKTLTITHVDKHKQFIFTLAQLFNTQFPNKLQNCYIYEAPSIFSQIFSMLSVIIDKETRNKIKIIK